MTQQSLPASRLLVGEPRDAHVARAFMRQLAAEHGLDGAADDAVVVVSELVTNAVVYGTPPISLAIAVHFDSVVIAVHDKNVDSPQRQHPDADDERGRGLAIVEKLTTSWRVEHEEGGKTVIAHVPLQRVIAHVPLQRHSPRSATE